ncbi:MAG: putative metal-binding motif-containing protein [Myxococcota bacterium]
MDDDQDGDGFGPCGGDCDESDPSISPVANEICGDGVDNDCDTVVDEGCP